MEIDRTQTLDEYCKTLFELQQRLKDYEKIENKDEIRKFYASHNYSEEDIENEIWKEYPKNSAYLVSNKGRIKFNGQIQHQVDKIDTETGKTKWGYLVLSNKNLLQEYIYNFVAYTFLGKIDGDGYHVHHITNDGNDNSADNLILLTAVEHSLVHGFKIDN